jgi:hypothetical protein
MFLSFFVKDFTFRYYAFLFIFKGMHELIQNSLRECKTFFLSLAKASSFLWNRN